MSLVANGQPPANTPKGVLFFMHALGRRALPPTISVAGRNLILTEFVKHDFFAATGFYVDPIDNSKWVAKLSRTEPLIGLPMKWLGRYLCNREYRFYHKLRDLRHVPQLLGKVGQTGFVHSYIDGQPVMDGVAIPDDFFDQILSIIDKLYTRGLAIVDTNKPENILLGKDGLPYLIDFQISFDLASWGGIWPGTILLRILRRTDVYHILKHKRRLQPHLLTDDERQLLDKQSLSIRLHRKLTKPYFLIRRRLMNWLRNRGKLMPEGSK